MQVTKNNDQYSILNLTENQLLLILDGLPDNHILKDLIEFKLNQDKEISPK